MPEPQERVLVVKAEWIHSLHETRGFLPEIHPDFFPGLKKQAFFMNRSQAEKDPSFRQVIPYVLVRNDGKYLTVTRLKTQGEERLHDRMSLGIGGHINPVDGDEGDYLEAGLKRELSEELSVDDPPGWSDLDSLGLICDDTNEVSRVHLGLVLRWDVGYPIQIRETDKMRGEYLAPEAIGAARDRLENWSRLVYDGLISPSARLDSVAAATEVASNPAGSPHDREAHLQ